MWCSQDGEGAVSTLLDVSMAVSRNSGRAEGGYTLLAALSLPIAFSTLLNVSLAVLRKYLFELRVGIHFERI